jgi:uncharacterized linocin/CFP29 family protein
MNHLLRELAPIAPGAWEMIEEEATRTLKLRLAGRKLVDFSGPLGWAASAVPLGRVERAGAEPAPGVQARVRKVQPFVELRVPFELSREELEAAARGAKDVNLDALRDAATSAALAEDRAIFHGYAAAGIQGLMQAPEGRGLTLSDNYAKYPDVVAAAVDRLRGAGVGGPYAIALGPRCYTGLTTTTIGGYPVIELVRRLLDGPIVWAPSIDGAAVVSLRGGDFELTVGEDFSIGYLEHSAQSVRLFLQESFTFRALDAGAAVPLSYTKG